MPREEAMYRYQTLVFVKQYNLGFIVHTLCHYCEMVATAAGKTFAWRRLEELQVEDEGEIQHLGTNIFRWFPASPAYSHLGTVSSSHGLSCMGTC